MRTILTHVLLFLAVSMAAGQTSQFTIDTSRTTTESIFRIDTLRIGSFFVAHEPQVIIYRYEYIMYWENDQLKRAPGYAVTIEAKNSLELYGWYVRYRLGNMELQTRDDADYYIYPKRPIKREDIFGLVGETVEKIPLRKKAGK